MTRPYYEDESVTLYHGDCRDVLAAMPDRSVDCVITDPPYSANTHRMAKANRRGTARKLVHFDSFTAKDVDTALAECGRVSRRWVLATLDYKHLFPLEEHPPAGLRLLRIGIWAKTNPMPQVSGDRPGQGWEAVGFFHRADTRPTWHGGGRSGVWVSGIVGDGLHPTAKPLPMVSDWVRLFSDPGNTILDPFAGSGTTIRAAVNEGRRAIACEIDERYCESIAKRMAQGVFDFGGAA